MAAYQPVVMAEVLCHVVQFMPAVVQNRAA